MRKLIIIILSLAAVVVASLFIFKQTALSPILGSNNVSDNLPAPVPSFDKNIMSLTDASSIWLVVNKSRIINPINYVPADLLTPSVPLRGGAGSEEMKLRKEPAEALERMVKSAKTKGALLKIASGYRSYNAQISTYNNEVKQYGKATADTQSARPGHSEHQTGLAADLQDVNGKCVVADCFKDLPEGKWLAEHAWEYGFIIRYPLGKETITGYRYEPWHVRFVGEELATELHKTGIQTLEEFFEVVEKQPY